MLLPEHGNLLTEIFSVNEYTESSRRKEYGSCKITDLQEVICVRVLPSLQTIKIPRMVYLKSMNIYARCISYSSLMDRFSQELRVSS